MCIAIPLLNLIRASEIVGALESVSVDDLERRGVSVEVRASKTGS
jgi:hypothetical protein